MPTFKLLQQTHPEYREELWRKMTLVANGGVELLDALQNPEDHGIGDGEEFLVRRMGEGAVYEERKRRAFVLPNLPHILGFFASSTLADAPAVKEKAEQQTAPAPDAVPSEPEQTPKAQEQDPADGTEAPSPDAGAADAEPADPLAQEDEPTWYEDFQDDVDRAGTDLPEFMRQRLVDALTLQSAYVLVDFPATPGDAAVETLYEEDAAGLTDGYFMPVERRSVLDWERDESGKFIWAKMRTISHPLDDPLAPRNVIRYEWRILRAAPDQLDPEAEGAPASSMEVYRLDWDTSNGSTPPPETPATLISAAPMRYSGFPLVELTVPNGLWVGSKVYPAEIQLMNKRNVKAWSEDITAFKFLVVTLLDDQAKALGQFGDGSMKALRVGEDIQWRGAPHEDIAQLRDTCTELTEEIHRVANALALAAPLGAIQQAASGEAKRRDNQPSTIVCRALGSLVRDMIQQLFDRLADGRGEDVEFEVSGLSRFDDGSSMLDLLIGGIDTKIQSDSALVELQKRAVDELLPDLTPILRAEIEAELEKRVSQRRAKRDALAQATIDNPQAMMGGAVGPGMPPAPPGGGE